MASLLGESLGSPGHAGLMTRIVTTSYRYKRPPRKRKAVPLEVPAIVRAVDPAKARKHAAKAAGPGSVSGGSQDAPANVSHRSSPTVMAAMTTTGSLQSRPSSPSGGGGSASPMCPT
jgi:hypothetical protein